MPFTKSLVTGTVQILVRLFMLQLIIGRILESCAFIVTIGLVQIKFDPMDVLWPSWSGKIFLFYFVINCMVSFFELRISAYRSYGGWKRNVWLV